jgi:hypothetical protein
MGDTLLQPQGDLDFARRYNADQTIRDQNTKSYNVTFGTDYKAKYIFDALYRRDGNSLLPPTSRWNDNNASERGMACRRRAVVDVQVDSRRSSSAIRSARRETIRSSPISTRPISRTRARSGSSSRTWATT